MNLKTRTIFFLSFLILTFSACKEEQNQMLMSMSGRPGEVIVVCTQNQWNGDIGAELKSFLEMPIYGMPQQEPLFTVIRTNADDFQRIFKTFRNVLIIDLDTNRMANGEVTYHKNAYSNGQFLIKIKTNSKKECLELLAANKDKIVYNIQAKELNRLKSQFASKPNKSVIERIEKLLQLKIAAPKVAVIATQDSAHAWIRIEREKLKGGYQHQISQGVLLAKVPYTGQSQLLDSSLLTLRDALLKKYIPGPTKGSYMTTEYRFEPPVIKEINYNGHYAKEIHGLWRVEGDFMGGPMVTYFVLNEMEEMLYCFAGYAFAPQFEKREFYREVEAITRTIEFTNN